MAESLRKNLGFDVQLNIWMDMLGPVAFAWIDRDQKTTFKAAAE